MAAWDHDKKEVGDENVQSWTNPCILFDRTFWAAGISVTLWQLGTNKAACWPWLPATLLHNRWHIWWRQLVHTTRGLQSYLWQVWLLKTNWSQDDIVLQATNGFSSEKLVLSKKRRWGGGCLKFYSNMFSIKEHTMMLIIKHVWMSLKKDIPGCDLTLMTFRYC